jgi:hypothetical protein
VYSLATILGCQSVCDNCPLFSHALQEHSSCLFATCHSFLRVCHLLCLARPSIGCHLLQYNFALLVSVPPLGCLLVTAWRTRQAQGDDLCHPSLSCTSVLPLWSRRDVKGIGGIRPDIAESDVCGRIAQDCGSLRAQSRFGGRTSHKHDRTESHDEPWLYAHTSVPCDGGWRRGVDMVLSSVCPTILPLGVVTAPVCSSPSLQTASTHPLPQWIVPPTVPRGQRVLSGTNQLEEPPWLCWDKPWG